VNPYRISIYDKAFGFVDWLGAPLRLEIHLRHNDMSTAQITVDADDPKAVGLNAAGARVVIERGDDFLMSGRVSLVSAKGPRSEGELTFTVEDDFRVVRDVLAWPVPTGSVSADGTINGQTVEYYTKSGPAETVVKDIIQKNAVTRLGLPITIAPDQGRGDSVTFTGRFHPLRDRLFPAIDQAGIGVTVRQSGAGLVMDCYTPRVFSPTLSEESGTLTNWDYSTSAPKNTRVIVGGQGEGTARTFKQFVDTGRETDWADKIEVFQDARDTSVGDIYAARAAETLAEGAPMSGFSLTLSETETFRYGGPDGVERGDQVTVKMGSLTATDVLREATLIFDGDGETITPIVGERRDDPNRRLAQTLRTLNADNNDRKAR
jgi:hypothetical protein